MKSGTSLASQRDPFARINSAKLDLFRRCTVRVGIIKLRHYSVSNAFSLSPAGRKRKEGGRGKKQGELCLQAPAFIVRSSDPPSIPDADSRLQLFIAFPFHLSAEQGVETLASDRAPE